MKILSILVLTLSIATVTRSFSQLPENAEDISPLLAGETFPDVEVTGTDARAVSLLQIVKEKPTVVIFYRGGWCPYCNHHLAELAGIEDSVIAAGYQIVAISPDDVAHEEATAEKKGLHYRLFSDASGTLSRAVGIAFKAPERYYKRLSDRSSGLNEGFLPVPSVFVLDTHGEILFEYINPNYKKRISGKLLLAVLRTLD
ncbi:MAG: peroxiredoxin-like family protein [Saprospiraceae bacterium]